MRKLLHVRLEAILNSMTETVVVIDGDRRISFVNQSAIDLLGVEPVLGERLEKYVSSSTLHEVFVDASRGNQADGEFVYKTPRGAEISIMARSAPTGIKNEVVIVMHDVTELRRLETVRRDFIANIAHELRTPTTVIKATAETLLDGAIDDPIHGPKFLESVLRNSERLTNILGDLLDISRLEAGEYSLDLEPIELREAVDRSLRVIEQMAAEKSIALHNEVASDQWVRADKNALDQILLNLLNNAVKHTQAGGKIEVFARRDDPSIVVEVQDNGPGIPASARDRIFERFFRVDTARARRTGGSGLGLSIVKHLVAEMDGAVGFRPVEPHGACIWFSLPVVSEPRID
jgi:two-component system phosphate regulon sensor histidine kinase PhoR